MGDIRELQDHLYHCLPKLRGTWISGRKKYEDIVAAALGAQVEKAETKRRYWDCVWKDWRIELKKGEVLLDLVRYSEMLLNTCPESQEEVVTLFLYGKDNEIPEICGVFTEQLLSVLRLTKKIASTLLRIRRHVVGKQLWAMTKVRRAQIHRIATFHLVYCDES